MTQGRFARRKRHRQEMSNGIETDTHRPVRSQTFHGQPSSYSEEDTTATHVSVYAWGDNGSGQCLGGMPSSLESVVAHPSHVHLPPERRDFGQLCAGWEQSFLVSRRGTLWAGGSNRGGCIAEEDVEQVLGIQRVAFADVEDVAIGAVSAGREHIVALQRGGSSLITWGCSNEFGQTGQGVRRVGLGPCGPRCLTVQTKVRVCAVACGQDHTLALTERGEVFAWGDGTLGQLGLLPPGCSSRKDAELGAEPAPRRVEVGALQGLPVRQIAAGGQHSMAIGISGQVAAWGSNRHGRLGLGADCSARKIVPVPELIPELPAVARGCAAGGRHSAVILRKGRVFLAGDNQQGQLGQPRGEMSNSLGMFLELPFADRGLQARAVALGEAHTLILSIEGELYGMGANDRGQLADDVGDCFDAPRLVVLPDPELIIWAIAAGPGHCAVLASRPPDLHVRLPVDRNLRPPTAPSSLVGRTRSLPQALPQEESEDESETPLRRTLAFHGNAAALPAPAPAAEPEAVSEATPLSEEGDQGGVEEDDSILERLRSSFCLSRQSIKRQLHVPLQLKTTPGHAIIKQSHQVVRPGVAADIGFTCLAVKDLAQMVQAIHKPGGLEPLRLTIAATLRCPAVLSSSFLFPGLFEAHLDASGLCEQLLKARGKLQEESMAVAKHWAMASATTMRSLGASGGPSRHLCTRDQVRALVVALMVPDWPALLADFPNQEHESYDAVCPLLRCVACLPLAGRRAFRDVVAEECGDLAVLRDILLPAARSFANAALRQSNKKHSIQPELWEALLLLQLLWAADARRLEIAKAAAQAARAAKTLPDAAPTWSIGRSLSVTAAADLGVVHRSAPTAGLELPRASFQVEELGQSDFPPELELQLFRQHAQMQVVEPQALCSDPKWEVDAKGMLPKAFLSFMANSNLVPIVFKQKVLRVENAVRQQEIQQQQLMQHLPGLPGIIQIINPQQIRPQQLFFIMEVHRDELLSDTAVALHTAQPEDLRKPLKVKFAGEEGVDEGGVTKEFFRLLSMQLFTPDFGMFKCDEESRYMWFDPGSNNSSEDFWLAGVIVGLAVYNNLPGLDINFPAALFKALKSVPTTMEDFQQAFPSHATSLEAVLEWAPPKGISDADQLFEDTFCLDFSVTFDTPTGKKTESLLPGSPPVTLARRSEFAEAFKDWFLQKGVLEQLNEFKRGFMHVCESPVFTCLSVVELQAIVAGEKDLDFANLRKGSQVVQGNVAFREGYLDSLWEVLHSLDADHKRQFLKFVTGSDLAPVGGLQRLGLKIQRNGGEPINSLPTSHTCFNLLMLPEYESQEKLRQLLITAIENTEGFGLQ